MFIRPMFSGLTFRELLGFGFAPFAIPLVLGLGFLALTQDLAATAGFELVYVCLLVIVPSWAVGSRLYADAKARGPVGLAACAAGGAIAKAVVIFGVGLIMSWIVFLFTFPLREVVPQWVHWASIVIPVGLAASVLGALEGVLLWSFVRYWPRMKVERGL